MRNDTLEMPEFNNIMSEEYPIITKTTNEKYPSFCWKIIISPQNQKRNKTNLICT